MRNTQLDSAKICNLVLLRACYWIFTNKIKYRRMLANQSMCKFLEPGKRNTTVVLWLACFLHSTATRFLWRKERLCDNRFFDNFPFFLVKTVIKERVPTQVKLNEREIVRVQYLLVPTGAVIALTSPFALCRNTSRANGYFVFSFSTDFGPNSKFAFSFGLLSSVVVIRPPLTGVMGVAKLLFGASGSLFAAVNGSFLVSRYW